jgi:ion channel POLLUX/CASTOR
MVINPFRNRIQYVVERLLLSGTLSRLAVAAVLIALVAGITGCSASSWHFGSEQSFSNPFEAIWWAFLRLSDPGYLGDDQGFGLRLISTIVTIAGYVLFLGVLVAILTQGLNEWISRLEQGLSPISAKNHVIFLGWSDRMPESSETWSRRNSPCCAFSGALAPAV